MTVASAAARLASWKPLISAGIGLFSFALAIYAGICYILLSGKDDAFNNVLPIVGLGSFFFVVASLVILVAGDGTGDPVVSVMESVSNATSLYVGPIASWVVILSLITVIPAFVLYFTPYRLETTADTIVITKTGQLLATGDSLPANRYDPREGLKVARIVHATPSLTAAENNAYAVAVSLEMGVVLKDGQALKHFLWHHRSALGFGTYEASPVDAEVVTIDSGLGNFIAPKVAQVVREVEHGSISGSKASMLLRLGTLVDHDKAHMPAWVGHVQVSDIAVPQWSLTQ